MSKFAIIITMFCLSIFYSQSVFNNVEKNIKDAIKKLGSEDPALIDEGRKALLYYGSLATDELIKALESDRIEVRFLSCQLLGEIRDKKAIQYLLQLFEPGKNKQKILSSITSCAAESLGLLQAKEAIPKLVESLQTDDAELKYNALESLGYLHATDAYDKIKKLLSDRSATYYDALIRAQAIRVIELLGAEGAIEDLKKLVTDTAVEKFTGKQVRYYAVRALQTATDFDFGDVTTEEDPSKVEQIYNKWIEWIKKSEKKEEPKEEKSDDNLKKFIEKVKEKQSEEKKDDKK